LSKAPLRILSEHKEEKTSGEKPAKIRSHAKAPQDHTPAALISKNFVKNDQDSRQNDQPPPRKAWSKRILTCYLP
jgi:hypothetical protein